MEALRLILRAGREATGKSQQDIATAAGVTVRTIQKMESGDPATMAITIRNVRNTLSEYGFSAVKDPTNACWLVRLKSELAPPPPEGEPELPSRVPGPVLIVARILLGATQRDVAMGARLSRTTVRKLEASDYQVADKSVKKMLSFLSSGGAKVEFSKEESSWSISWIDQESENETLKNK